jgi:hypothetical protein
LLHPRPLQKQKAYHWRIFTPASNQTIWPLLWWIIAPAFSTSRQKLIAFSFAFFASLLKAQQNLSAFSFKIKYLHSFIKPMLA